MLTTSADTFVGTEKGDVFNAYDIETFSGAKNSLTSIDSLDGGAGKDVLNVKTDATTLNAVTATISNIETINLESSGDIGATGAGNEFDTSTFTGVETLNATKGTSAYLKAAATTDVNVSGITGTTAEVEVTGGKTVTVNHKMDTTGDKIAVNGAVNVDVTATDVIDTTNDIKIGTTANGAVTGTVNVTSTGAKIADAAGLKATAMSTIDVIGGTTVTVTQSANSTSGNAKLADNVGDIVTQGAVTVTAGNATTTVTVKQDDQVAAVAAVVAAGANQTQTVTFSAMAKNDTVTVNNLTFTASKALSAAEVAAAFSNLTAGDTQSLSGTANGTYSNYNNTLAYTSGAANGATVTFSAATQTSTQTAPLNVGSTGTVATNPVVTAGVAGVTTATAKDGVIGVANGLVTIDDNATKSITDITVDGYGAGAQLGATAGAGISASLDKLTTLTLKNSGAGTATVDTLSTGALTLNLVDVDGLVNLDGSGSATLTSLTINTSGEASTGPITAAGATTVTINAEAALSGASTFTAATLIDVNGTAKVDLTGATTNAITLATIDASGNTGGVTAVLGASNSVKFTGGTGNDSLTLAAATTGIAAGKNIDMGAGNDTLTMLGLAAAGNIAATVTGGAGDADVIALSAANANDTALSSSTAFNGKIDGFEILSLGASIAAATDGDTVNLTNMDGISYVQSANTDVDTKAIVTFTGAVTALSAADTVNFVLNGVNYTVTSTGATVAALNTAIDAAIGVTGQVVASGAADLVLTATGSDTLVVGATAFNNGGATIAGTNTASTPGNVSLRLMNMANNGTLELNASGAGVNVVMADSKGATDTFNIILDDSADANGFAAGIVSITGNATDVAAGKTSSVETVNISVDDTFVDANKNGVDDTNAAFTMTLSEATATTVNVTGAGDLSLTTAAANLKTVDAHAMTGALTFTADNASMTVKGGAGNDVITISTTADGSKFYGNAGNDKFIIAAGADLITIDGGAGKDTFDFNGVSTNKSNFVVLNNVDSGDILDLAGVHNMTAFNSTKITLSVGATETTQAYLDQAMTTLTAGQVGWFQLNGNTYITADVGAESPNSFVDGQDFVVMITGLKDLSAASFNTTTDTLEIA